MDNSTERTARKERSEYRGGAASSRKGNKKAKNDSFVRLIILQSILCTAAVVLAFAICKLIPGAGERLKTDYSRLMARNMSVAEIFSGIKENAQAVFNPENIDGFEKKGDEANGETVAAGAVLYGSGGVDEDESAAEKGVTFSKYAISTEICHPLKNARVTSEFGYRVNPITGADGIHTGIDLAAAEGTPVACAYYGSVTDCGKNNSRGKYVEITHSESLSTLYCHLSEIYVEEGAVLRQGETLGLVGSTGWSTGPHLHFEMKIDGVKVDPAAVLYPNENQE